MTAIGDIGVSSVWIDRSHHLFFLQGLSIGSARLHEAAPRDWLILGGARQGVRRRSVLIGLASRHQLPADARYFVGKRDRDELWRLALEKFSNPRRKAILTHAGANMSDNRSGSCHKDRSQTLVTRPSYDAESGLAGRGMIFGRQA
jgi:hypothetical protein